MADDLIRVTALFASGRTAHFAELPFGVSTTEQLPGCRLTIGATSPELVTVDIEAEVGSATGTGGGTEPSQDPLAGIRYEVSVPLRNQSQVIVPDSGRWFMDAQTPISAWRFHRELHSGAEDVRLPLYVCTGGDGSSQVAIGLVSALHETDFEILEPVSNRALNVHTGRFAVRFRFGSAEFPLPAAEPGGTQRVTTRLWLHRPDPDAPETWVHTHRAFAEVQRVQSRLPAPETVPAPRPVWCSWVDWASDEVNEALVLDNVARGRELGIHTFIIDDGWFGPGLDSDYDVPLNIGDWEPDPHKCPDLARVITGVHRQGGELLLWCAPHAVGPAARSMPERSPYLMRDDQDRLLICPTRFHALCLRSPQARRIMADVCADLLRRWNIDGFKYDLFNWLPAEACRSTRHDHDTASSLAGLERTLRAIDEATRAVAPGHIVELKQNYGTAHLAGLGTMMRAGDAPYAPQVNFLRTLHVQGYTPYALNDYQTSTPQDSATDIAIAVIRMIAVGIPSYGADLTRLRGDRAAAVRHYNTWYTRHVARLATHREPLDPDFSVIAAPAEDSETLFLLRAGTALAPRRLPATVLNGTHARELILRLPEGPARATVLDATGAIVDVVRTGACPWSALAVPPGGMALLHADAAPGTAAGTGPEPC